MFDLKYNIIQKPSDCEGEVFPIVDIEGNVIDCATRKLCHSGSTLLHPVVHLHIFDSSGRLYLQQRSMKKDIQPGKWDTAVGGHIDFGETVLVALAREAREELGILGISESRTALDLKPQTSGTEIVASELFHYVWTSVVEREMINAFAIVYDGPFYPDHDEVDQGKFWDLHELESSIGNNLLTPQFEQELPRLLLQPLVRNLFLK